MVYYKFDEKDPGYNYVADYSDWDRHVEIL